MTEPVATALIEEWRALDALLTGLSEEEWAAPTCLPGWGVRDVVAHLVGTESVLSGSDVPLSDVDVRALPHVRNDMGATNEQWVQALQAETVPVLLERFRTVTQARASELAAMSRADFDAPSWTPVGEGTYRQFMTIRLFDCWLHEQDIRDAAGRPGHDTGPAAETAVERISGGLGYVVGKRAAAPPGSAVTFQLTGPIRRTLFVQVDQRARLVDCLDRSATTTLTLSSDTFVRLGGGRVTASGAAVEIDGDAELGQRVLANMAITP